MTKENNEDGKTEISEYIPIWKYLLLNLSTFCLFQFLWIFRQWNYLYSEEKLIISPAKRTAFSPITFGALVYNCNKINYFNKATNIAFSIIYGILYFLSYLVAVETNNYALYFISVIILLPFVQIQNNKYSKNQNITAFRKTKIWQKIILGLMMIISIAYLIIQLSGSY